MSSSLATRRRPLSRPSAARWSYGAVSVDAELLDAFRRGEAAAHPGTLLESVALRALGRADLAEDATQQTFVRAWQAADRIDIDRDPAPWLATIAKRVAIDIYRREARRPAGSLDDAAPDDTALVTLPPELDTLDAIWRVRRAIDALPSDESVIVRMQHLEGMTHSEISEQLEIPLGTVKSRSSRAHRRLASLLGHLRESVA